MQILQLDNRYGEAIAVVSKDKDGRLVATSVVLASSKLLQVSHEIAPKQFDYGICRHYPQFLRVLFTLKTTQRAD
jgi:hypothetical protein